MMSTPWKLLFLVAGPGLGAGVVAALVVAFGVYIAWVDPADFDQTLAIALFLQLFAASTGFRDRQRRGHFDPALAGGVSPWRIAAGHWLASTALGLLVWFVLGVIDLVARRDQWPAAFTPEALIVLLYMSTMAWTISVIVGRYGGAIVWMTILFSMVALQELQGLRQVFTPNPETGAELMRTVASVLVCPPFMFLYPSIDHRVLVIVAVATAAAWAIGAVVIDLFDATLQET